MKRQELFWIITLVASVIVLFFYKTVFFGNIPFPGDVLASDFQPWRSTSYLGYGAGGIPNKAQYPDTLRQLYPWKTLVVESLKHGDLPLWNPYNFSGTPLLANFQSAALYPLGIFYLFLSQVDAWTVLIILQPLLAILFTYLYSRNIGVGTMGSWLAALSYGLSGFMAVWLEYNTVGHVILWLPLMLLAIEHLKKYPRVLWLGVLTCIHAAALLAGHPQVYAYMLVFTFTYTLFRADRFMYKYILGFTALGIGVAGVQILPGIELIALAARSPHDATQLFTKILIQPWQVLALPFPNLFGNPATRTYWPADTFVGKVTTIGLIPLFFSLSALRRKDAVTKWFIFATAITLLLVTNTPVSQLLYRVPIPLISSSSPTLMSFLFAFSLCMTCALGLDYWLKDAHSTKKLIRRTFQVGVAFGILFLATRLPTTPIFSEHASVATRALLYGALVSTATLSLFWIAIKFPRYRQHAILVLLVIHTLDLFMFFQRFNPFIPKTLVFPDHPLLSYLTQKAPDRYWGYGTAGIAANMASQYGMFSPEGYDPLYPKWYGEFLYSYRDGKLITQFDNATRSDAGITSVFGDGGLSDPKKQKILNAVSARYILDRTENASTADTLPPDTLRNIYEYNSWRVYENIHAAPRAYLVNDIKTYTDASRFSDQFFASDFIPGTSVLLPISSKNIPETSGSGSATIVSYLPERVTIRTDSPVPAILVLTDTYYPGWNATVDDAPAEILRANWTMRGVAVPQGVHLTVMTYSPESVRYGILLSMISISITIIGLLLIYQKTYE